MSTPTVADLVAEEDRIDELRLKAFKTNSPDDRQAYFDATSKWFQDRWYRRLDAERALSPAATEPVAWRVRVRSGDQAALDKLIREAEQRGQIKAGGVFADTDPEARYIEDMQNACPACEGSGHKDDGQAALDKLIADARADAFREAAEIAKAHPMRCAAQIEVVIRSTLSSAILARINEPQEGGVC
ncbi:hypothetical protein [Paracoccus sp. (in: a-proteobacteria)]|uniref:hypothetical protein n=1 Tax=Paracoccus sp. TaxID=267 RepID=UPI002AFF2CAF|nr:hypothetical protein [Paracoccus sp. (in: a-proteobacteria)]